MVAARKNSQLKLPPRASSREVQQFLELFKRLRLRLPSDSAIRITKTRQRRDGSQKILVSYNGELPIKVGRLDEPIYMQVPLAAALLLDRTGKLIDFSVQKPDSSTRDLLKEELESKLNRGDVTFLEPEAKVSTVGLAAKGTPFYIQKDRSGRRHLKRAFFASR